MKRWSLLLPFALLGCASETADDTSAVEPSTVAPVADTADTAAEAAPEIPETNPPPARAGEIPFGWMLAGMAPDQYEAAVDDEVVHHGRFSGRLRATADAPRAFGAMSQVFDATRFRGSRVRLRGMVKTDGVTGWAGLWMRVDEGGQTSVIDNMQDRPLVGDLDYEEVVVVLDVAEHADKIAFGLILDGPGTVWVDALALEKVDLSVATTGIGSKERPLPEEPQNLSFVE